MEKPELMYEDVTQHAERAIYEAMEDIRVELAKTRDYNSAMAMCRRIRELTAAMLLLQDAASDHLESLE